MPFFFLLLFGVISIFRTAASQLIMEVNPLVVNGGISPHRNLTIKCAIQPDAKLKEIYNIQLLRKTRKNKGFVPIAQLNLVSHSSPAFVSNAPADIVERSAVSGNCDNNVLTNAFLKLEINTTLVKRNDEGTYKCSLAYQAHNWISKQTTSSSNITVVLSDVDSAGQGTSTKVASSTLWILIFVVLAVC